MAFNTALSICRQTNLSHWPNGDDSCLFNIMTNIRNIHTVLALWCHLNSIKDGPSFWAARFTAPPSRVDYRWAVARTVLRKGPIPLADFFADPFTHCSAARPLPVRDCTLAHHYLISPVRLSEVRGVAVCNKVSITAVQSGRNVRVCIESAHRRYL